jgi:hypothetical protein
MNPNSAHQRWSFWQYRIYPGGTKRPDFATVKQNAARFGLLLFGSASEMRVVQKTDDDARLYWEISVRTEGHPVHDPLWVEWVHAQWRRFLVHGFGDSEVLCHARLEAGDRQDGTPADQLIILPALPHEGVV